MSRQLACTLLVFALLVSVSLVHAEQQYYSPTLSERLDSLRHDFLGDRFGGKRKTTSTHRRKPVKSQPKSPAAIATDSQEPHLSQEPGPTIAPVDNSRRAVGSSRRRNNVPNTASRPPVQRPSVARPTATTATTTATQVPTKSVRSSLSLQERLSAANQFEPEKTSKPESPKKLTTDEATSTKPSASEEPTLIPPTASRLSEESSTLSVNAKSSDTTKPGETSSEPTEVVRLGGDDDASSSSSVTSSEATSSPALTAAVKDKSAGNDGAEGTLFSSQSAVLSVEATGPRKVRIGKEAVFVVSMRNTGEAPANDVVVTINIPNNTEVVGNEVSAGAARAPLGLEHTDPLEWKIPRLEPHSRQTLTLRIVPRKSVPLDLTAQWTCSPETSQTVVEVQEPKIMMALSGPDEVPYGQSKLFKLTVSNPGNGDAENVMVNLLPIGRATDSATNHKLGTLRAGETKAIEVELTARQAGAIMIKAQAFADGGLRADVSEQIVVRRANLKVDIDGPKVKYAGTPCTYRVHITNIGNAVADNVQIAALLPPNAKYVASTSGGRADSEQARVQWTAGSLQPGAERVLQLQCTLQAPGENRLQVMLTAGDDLSGSAITSTRVESIADLKLEIRDPQGPIQVGEDTTYEIVVRNRGTKSAEEVEVVVFFSDGLEATSVKGGAYEIGRGQVLFRPIRSLGAGSETVYQIHARADRGGNHLLRAELACPSLATKLAAEEATHFYGDLEEEHGVAGEPVEPHVATQPQQSLKR